MLLKSSTLRLTQKISNIQKLKMLKKAFESPADVKVNTNFIFLSLQYPYYNVYDPIIA